MISDKYNILHIFSGYGGGISSLILNLIENKEVGFNFDVMAFSYDGGSSFIKIIERLGGHCYLMPRPRINGIFSFLMYVDKIFASNNYDLVHCHISGWASIPFWMASKCHGTKAFIVHAHSTIYDRKINRIKIVYNLNKWINYHVANAFMSCSDLAANYMFGKKYLKNKSAILIPNGINEKLFAHVITDDEQKLFRHQFEITPNKKVILHVGRFSPPKNHLFILDIIKELTHKCNDIVLLFAGDGQLLAGVKEKAEQMGLNNSVRFLGRRSDVSKLMQFADVMILPSFNEGLPTVAVECQAAGTPMLLSDKVTRQCDMGLSLLKFLPINNAELWATEISLILNTTSYNVRNCVDVIAEKGFSAHSAGVFYCEQLKQIIKQTGETV